MSLYRHMQSPGFLGFIVSASIAIAMPFLSGAQMIKRLGRSEACLQAPQPSGGRVGGRRGDTAAEDQVRVRRWADSRAATLAKGCMIALQVVLQTWLLAAYLLQIPAVSDALWEAAQSDPPPLLLETKAFLPAPASAAANTSWLPFDCKDGRELARALILWLGLPLGQDSSWGPEPPSDSGLDDAWLIMTLQGLVLLATALRLEAGR